MPSMKGADNPAWRGGHAGYRGPSWPTQRRAALERDRSECVVCGETADVTVHHVRPFRLFRDHESANDLNNLVTLCRLHHSEADNAIWRDTPELVASMRASFPDCRLYRDCRRCGQRFLAKPAERDCLACCTFTCDQCGETFVSRKRPNVRFCSRACNQAYRKTQRVFPHACVVCGTAILTGRYRCRTCHLNDPISSVRPGRRIGRPPKDRSASD
jgi:HNH endonuclease